MSADELKRRLMAAGIDNVSATKASYVLDQHPGAAVVGLVISMPNGDRCIIDRGAVRWVSLADFLSMMFPNRPGGVASW